MKKKLENFKDIGIKPEFIKALNELNITVPSAVQKLVIPALLERKTDLVCQAQTGSGKTAAFGLPILHFVDTKKKHIQALILSPTRELGQQIAKQLFKFTKFSDKVFTECVYGGEPIDRQISALRRPTHVLVATPGRLIDLVKRDCVDLSLVKTIVLDEADEMLSMGFKKELEEILKFVKQADQKWLFSATFPDGIKQIVANHMSPTALNVSIDSKNVVNKDIIHQFVLCDESEKVAMLLHYLKTQKDQRGMIFCKTKVAAQQLAKQLIAKNISTDALHGDLLQKERDKVMRAFKGKTLRVLVATDIAARGIDVDNLAFVVHYQLPDKDEYYTHRSGRTARAGKKGVSLAIVTSAERKQLRYLEKNLKIDFLEVK